MRTKLLAWAAAAAALLSSGAFLIAPMAGGTLPPFIMERLLVIGGTSTAVVIACAVALTRGRRRWFWLAAYPAVATAFIAGLFMIPATELDHVTLPNGHIVHLALDAIPTDASYSLWEETAGGLYWRRVDTDLSYSEDGRFVGDERLFLSRDNRRLLVKRGGVWTDCVYAARPHSVCDGTPPPPLWDDPNFEAAMHRNSQQLATLL